MDQELAYKKLAEIVENNNSFWVVSHVNPDGDAVGSAVALYHFLKKNKKKVTIIMPSEFPSIYRFLLNDKDIPLFIGEIPDTYEEKPDIIWILDMSIWDRLGPISDIIRKSQAMKVVLDHHRKGNINEGFAFIDPDAAAVGVLLYNLMADYMGQTLNEPIATALYTAIATDTGFFRYTNTTSEVHRIVSKLLKYPMDPNEVNIQVNENWPIGHMKLFGAALNSLKMYADGRIAVMKLELEAFKKCGAGWEDVDGLVEYARTIKNVEVAIILSEEPSGKVRLSFRSYGKIHMNELAGQFGGGGHHAAAGARTTGTLEDLIPRVVRACEDMLPPVEK